MWSDDDFRLLFAFIRDVRHLAGKPEDFAVYNDVILQDAEWAAEALRRIADGCCAAV